MVERLPQVLVNAGDDLDINAQVSRQAVGRHLLVEAFDDLDLTPEFSQALLARAPLALDIAPGRLMHFEGATEDALYAPQEVGRATEMARSSCNHAQLAYVAGYFSP